MLTPGQTTIFHDHGTPKVAVVTKVHDNGTVDLCVLQTSHRYISRSDGAVDDTAFDASAPRELDDGHPGKPALTSVKADNVVHDTVLEPVPAPHGHRAGGRRNAKVIPASHDPKGS